MLSVIIITKNEAHNIRSCLESIAWADDIVVVDSGSDDDTVNIAKEFTSNVFEAGWQGYGVQKQRALDKAKGDWILNLDADETVSPCLKDKIIDVMKGDDVDGYRIPIQMYFYNKPLRFSASPSRHVRLFKRAGARFSNDIVHEKILLPDGAKIKQLSQVIQHNSFQDVSHALYKINKYSSYTAKTRIINNKKSSFIKTLFGSGWMFFRCYILQLGFLDGTAGFLLSYFHAQGTFYRGIKQIYKDKSIDKLPE